MNRLSLLAGLALLASCASTPSPEVPVTARWFLLPSDFTDEVGVEFRGGLGGRPAHDGPHIYIFDDVEMAAFLRAVSKRKHEELHVEPQITSEGDFHWQISADGHVTHVRLDTEQSLDRHYTIMKLRLDGQSCPQRIPNDASLLIYHFDTNPSLHALLSLSPVAEAKHSKKPSHLHDSEYAAFAWCGGGCARLERHVEDYLHRHGINVGFEGSVTHGIFVRRTDLRSAVRLLMMPESGLTWDRNAGSSAMRLWSYGAMA